MHFDDQGSFTAKWHSPFIQIHLECIHDSITCTNPRKKYHRLAGCEPWKGSRNWGFQQGFSLKQYPRVQGGGALCVVSGTAAAARQVGGLLLYLILLNFTFYLSLIFLLLLLCACGFLWNFGTPVSPFLGFLSSISTPPSSCYKVKWIKLLCKA